MVIIFELTEKKEKHMKYTRIGAVLLLVGMGFMHCGSTRSVKELSPAQKEANLESFDFVWSTIHTQHYDTTFGGLDWYAVRDELRPEMEKASSMGEARRILLDMIRRLGLSHFNILPAEVFRQLKSTNASADRSADTGMDVFVDPPGAWVQSIREGSPAQKNNIATGWEILAVNGEPVRPILEKLAGEFDGKTIKTYYLTTEIQNRLTGNIGDSVQITFVDLNNDTLQTALPLTEKPGWKYQVGHMPSLYVHYESRWMADSVGYIHFTNFLDPVHVMGAFNRDMLQFKNARGLIIDIRGNGGGIIAMAMGMAGWFVSDKQQYLGTLHFRENDIKAVIYPRVNSYPGPLAILIDGLSASTSEIFAGGLQDIGRAHIIGTRSAGASLPSNIISLPNGDAFQYVLANYVSRGGTVLEGRGVAPDLAVTHTPESLASGTDRPLVEAAEMIRSSGKQ